MTAGTVAGRIDAEHDVGVRLQERPQLAAKAGELWGLGEVLRPDEIRRTRLQEISRAHATHGVERMIAEGEQREKGSGHARSLGDGLCQRAGPCVVIAPPVAQEQRGVGGQEVRQPERSQHRRQPRPGPHPDPCREHEEVGRGQREIEFALVRHAGQAGKGDADHPSQRGRGAKPDRRDQRTRPEQERQRETGPREISAISVQFASPLYPHRRRSFSVQVGRVLSDDVGEVGGAILKEVDRGGKTEQREHSGGGGRVPPGSRTSCAGAREARRRRRRRSARRWDV